MDYPQRNTDAAKKIWIGKRECGFRAQRLGLLPLTAVCGRFCQCRFSGDMSENFFRRREFDCRMSEQAIRLFFFQKIDRYPSTESNNNPLHEKQT